MHGIAALANSMRRGTLVTENTVGQRPESKGAAVVPMATGRAVVPCATRAGLMLAVMAVVASCSAGSAGSTVSGSAAIPAAASPSAASRSAGATAGQVSVSECPAPQAVGSLADREVVTSTHGTGITSRGVDCEYNSLQSILSDPVDGTVWSLEVQVNSGASLASDVPGVNTLADAKQDVSDECDSCTVTALPFFAPGSFQVVGTYTVDSQATDLMCEDWILDHQGRPTAVDVQASTLGGSSDMTQSSACALADGVTKLLTG